MSTPLTAEQENAIFQVLSHPRMSTYSVASGVTDNSDALTLYVWNSAISSAFFSSLQICEVAVRNAVACALEMKYGPAWPWDANFIKTLKQPMKEELKKAKDGIPTGMTGKVIAELKFHFWCQMFTSGQDQHIWKSYLHVVFPNLPAPLSVLGARALLHQYLNIVRKFRNRIAHHEPIFAYNLSEHQMRIHALIHFRCNETLNWLTQWENISQLITSKP